MRITPAVPQNLKNGSDVAGSWEMRYASDAGGMGALMELHRDGNKVTGTWSGPLGEGRAITGTWRNGYVELSFAGEWPKESPRGAPGPAAAQMRPPNPTTITSQKMSRFIATSPPDALAPRHPGGAAHLTRSPHCTRV